ncbi:MAG: response regulator transcription factor [Polyangiales bacterium]
MSVGPVSALLVEDDARLAHFTADYLAGHDVQVTHVHDGEAALQELGRQRFDIVVLDLMLPRRSGISVCQIIRQDSDVPIVMVTARVEEADRVLGLESGADDYVLKPFSPRELLARMHAVIRRDRGYLSARPRAIAVGTLQLEEATRTVTVDGEHVALTTAEFGLLVALAKRPGVIFTREQLLRLVRGDDEAVFDRAIDVQVSRLRQKLAAKPGGKGLIRTVRGVGYMLGEPS